MKNLDEMIMGITATSAAKGHIKLKYLAVAGGCGPELTLDCALAQQTIAALQAVLSGALSYNSWDMHNMRASYEGKLTLAEEAAIDAAPIIPEKRGRA